MEKPEFPEQNHLLWKAFFYIAGISVLFVWNSVLGLTDYWSMKYRDGVQNSYGFYFNVGQLLAFLFFDKLNRLIHFRIHIIIWPVFNICMFYLYIIVGETMTGENNESLRCWIFLGGCFLQGFANNTLQCCLSRFVFNFGGTAINSYNAGVSIAGVSCTFIAFQLTYVPCSVTYKFVIYLVFVTVLLSVILIVFTMYFNRYASLTQNSTNQVENYFNEESSNSGTKSKAPTLTNYTGIILDSNYSIQSKVEEVLANNQQKESWSDRFNAFKHIHPYAFQILFCFVVTLGIFPAITFITGVGVGPRHGYALTVLLFNIGDLSGRLIYTYLPVSDGIVLKTYGMIRNVFFPLMFALCVVFKDNWFWGSTVLSIQLIIGLAFTTGHFSNAIFANAPGRLNDKDKKYCAFILVMTLLSGLCYGALIDVLTLG